MIKNIIYEKLTPVESDESGEGNETSIHKCYLLIHEEMDENIDRRYIILL